MNYLSPTSSVTRVPLESVLAVAARSRSWRTTGRPSAVWFSVTDKTYDLVTTIDRTGSSGRLHHIAFATDTREDILRAADVCLEAGVHIETGSPQARHPADLLPVRPGARRQPHRAVQCRRAPAPRARLEGHLVDAAERAKGQAWGLKTIESFHTHGTPPLDETT